MSGGGEAGASSLAELARRLGHDFAEPLLLREALTHPSLDIGRRGAAAFGYQRLEFLGDRVLGVTIAEWLFERFPGEPEGALDRRHSALVRRETLAEVAGALGLGAYLLLSPGEDEAGGRANPAILADALEAVIAALWLDGGPDIVRRFIRRHWADIIERDHRPPRDPKTELQEWAQSRGMALPRYRILSRAGPDHVPMFEVEVAVEGQPPVVGAGPSKRVAEKDAAARLLSVLTDR